MMKAVAEAMQIRAATILDPGERKKYEKWARQTQNRARIIAAIELAKSEPGIAVSSADLDQDGMTINAQNGVIDLRTGELRPHSRADLMTKMCDANYDPGADCARFLAFVRRIMAEDPELIAFMQRLLGYCITGDTSEQCLFFLHGRGANGKSVLLNTVRAVLGPYAKQAQAETFMKRGNAASNDLARLAGVRLITVSELEDGRQAAESLLKQFTGGDTLTVRYLFQEFFEYVPIGKLVIAANHQPTLTASDDAIWRRIHQIPFSVVIPPPERDRQLAAKLLAERDGILAWLVEGAVDYLKNGLQVPASVRNATAAYRREIDSLGMFLDDCCEREPTARATTSLLYAAYTKWCADEGAEPMKVDQFGRELTKRGFGREKIGGVAWRTGLRVRSELQHGRAA